MAVRDESLIAYFGIHRTNGNDGYVGGILVINDKGIPRDIRFTHPISPNAAQRTLYGNTLEPHIFVELIGSQLVSALAVSPLCCVVEDASLLDLSEHVALPIVHIEPANAPRASNGRSEGAYRLDSGISGDRPVNIKVVQATDEEVIRDILSRISAHHDLLEPFDRIATAVELLPSMDSDFA